MKIKVFKISLCYLLIIILAYANTFAQPPRLSREVLSDIVKSIPSPLEISFLIQDLSIQYEPQFIISSKKTSQYKTSFQQALMLGMYSTDVGYAHLYGKIADSKKSIKATFKMARAMKVHQLIDTKEIQQILKRPSNLDSLLLATNTSLEKMNEYFYKQKTTEYTILILTGGWVESLYITGKITKKFPNELLKNRVGEQKIILEQLLLLLSFYEENPRVKALIKELNQLQKVYNQVKIDFQYKNPTTKQDDNGILIVDDYSTRRFCKK